MEVSGDFHGRFPMEKELQVTNEQELGKASPQVFKIWRKKLISLAGNRTSIPQFSSPYSRYTD
jgi:hypothetical protein